MNNHPKSTGSEIGEPINSPCEGGKCTSWNDEVHGAKHSVCEKHATMYENANNPKSTDKEKILEDQLDEQFLPTESSRIYFRSALKEAKKSAYVRGRNDAVDFIILESGRTTWDSGNVWEVEEKTMKAARSNDEQRCPCDMHKPSEDRNHAFADCPHHKRSNDEGK